MTYWATATEIARLKGWTERNVVVLASRHHWRSRGYNPRQYAMEDLAAYLQTRKPEDLRKRATL